MRVCTFNAFQATTMPYRHVRRPGLAATFAYFAHHNIDVLCMQELNAARMGPVMYCVWRLCLLVPLLRDSALMEYVEYLAVAEGLLLPLFANDNRSDVIRTARQFGYSHHASVPQPRYFLDCGLLILSRFPVDPQSVALTYLPRDAGNRPGILAATLTLPASAASSGEAERVRVYNLHFVPSLLSVTPVFRLLNAANSLLGRDTRQLRQQHFTTLIEDIKRRQQADERLLCVVAGDFNVTAGSEEDSRMSERVKSEAGLRFVTMQPRRPTACERTFAHEVDHIIVCDRVMSRWRKNYKHRPSQPPALDCRCTADADEPSGDKKAVSKAAHCSIGEVLHVWPAHKADQLHSTRVDSMFSSDQSDHYPLLADLSFI